MEGQAGINVTHALLGLAAIVVGGAVLFAGVGVAPGRALAWALALGCAAVGTFFAWRGR